MRYFKIMSSEEIIGAEKYEKPDWVGLEKNGTQVRCSERNARGILIFGGSTTAQLVGKDPIGDTEYDVTEIYGTEYEQIVADHPLAETVPEEDTEEPSEDDSLRMMSNAELRAAYRDLSGKVDNLEEALLEMSEIVYA